MFRSKGDNFSYTVSRIQFEFLDGGGADGQRGGSRRGGMRSLLSDVPGPGSQAAPASDSHWERVEDVCGQGTEHTPLVCPYI